MQYFILFTCQQNKKELDFIVQELQFENWKQFYFKELGNLQLSCKYFKETLKKLYVHPDLKELASRGCIKTKHIKNWNSIYEKVKNISLAEITLEILDKTYNDLGFCQKLQQQPQQRKKKRDDK